MIYGLFDLDDRYCAFDQSLTLHHSYVILSKTNFADREMTCDPGYISLGLNLNP